ncbi:venom carboxylesterase-6-like [Arctopsyche grandis]|uniref:venom carboxylesterase-6-like n=1 Tax=Arctopsyche grandis TaxID=121162 RepID=UPI00406D7154
MSKLQLLLVIFLCFVDIVFNYQTIYESNNTNSLSYVESQYNTRKKRESDKQDDGVEFQLPTVKHNLGITGKNMMHEKDSMKKVIPMINENNVTVKVDNLSRKEDLKKKVSAVVSTSNGMVEGLFVEKNNTKYYSFRGIRYAEKPIRFQASAPVKPWKGIKNATQYPTLCYQKTEIFGIVGGSEDCLYLNINTPTIQDKKLPVIVWIYGGAYKFGTASFETYNPIRFTKKGIIVVSIYYRVGAFGFLSTRSEHAPGNVGLKDVVLGLRWVRKNIHMFGGDTHNICLYGLSSGGSVVEYLTLSPMSHGLFDKAISHSGTSMSTLMYTERPIETAFKLGTYLGFQNKDLDELMEFLQKANASSIVEANHKMDQDDSTFMSLHFVPSCEEKLSGEVFLDDHPENILRSGNYYQVPYLMGYNNKEGISELSYIKNLTTFLKSMNSMFEYVQPKDLFDGVKYRKRRTILKQIQKYYFGDDPISMDKAQDFIDLIGDATFAYGVHKSVDIRAHNTKYPLYYYEFAYHEAHSIIYQRDDVNITGAGHGEDLSYVFIILDREWSDRAKLVSDRYVQMYTNFAKYGNPTPNQTELIPVLWPPVKNDSFPYLRISDTMEIKQDGNRDRFKFWSKIYADRYQ